jgi:hypothetical protein
LRNLGRNSEQGVPEGPTVEAAIDAGLQFQDAQTLAALPAPCLVHHYRRGVTSTSRLTSSPSRMLATANGGNTSLTLDPSPDRTVISPLLRSISVIRPAS